MKAGTLKAGTSKAGMCSLTAISIYQVDRISADLERINGVNGVKRRYAINFRGSVHDRAISARAADVPRGMRRR